MFLLILLFISFLNAETFYLSSKKTSFYEMNVQVNGNDISDKIISSNKVVLDQYLVDGTNILSVCYSYNPDQGQPNVKQLSKVELYNTKVNTKIRGLAHITPKKLVPEYISVSPQPRAFSTQEQHCVTHNFEDYSEEQLLAMEARFNPATVENVAEQVEPSVVESINNDEVLNTKSEQLVEESVAENSKVLQESNTEKNSKAQLSEPAPQMNPTSTVVDQQPPADVIFEESVVENENNLTEPQVDSTSAQEALSFIPEEDFVVPVAPPASNTPTEVADGQNFMEEELPADMQAFEEGQMAFSEPSQDSAPEVQEAEKRGEIPEDAFVYEESPEQQTVSEDKDRGVASDKELTNLSDEEFFEELEIQ